MNSNFKILYTIFTLISVYFFLADVLYFKFSLNGIWASKILFISWLIVTIILIIKNWKSKKAKFSLLILVFLPLFLLIISGILLFDILSGITNSNSINKINVKNYSIYVKTSVLSGDFVVLYKKLYLLKEMKSSKLENYDEFKIKNATNAKIEYETENKIIIQFSNNTSKKSIEFEK